MVTQKEKAASKRHTFAPGNGGTAKRGPGAAKPDISNLIASSALIAPTDDQIFYLRLLARYLCTRKGIKTLTLADSAEIKGDQKQRENKTQAFLNRYTRGAQALVDYQAFWKGILKLYIERKHQGVELFDDPIMSQAFGLVFPHFSLNDRKDDFFIDAPLQRWFSIEPQRSRDVCRHYSGLWWIVRPSTSKTRTGQETEFNLALLNIQPEEVSNTPLPLFKVHQAAGGASGGGGITSQGRVLAFHSDQILLLGKRRGSQTLTQMSWKYAWDPDRLRRENLIQGTIFTVNTHGVLIQSYFHGCFIEKSEHLRGSEFDDAESFLRGFLGVRTEAEMAEVPTSVHEVQLLRPLQTNPDSPPHGLSALKGIGSPHRPAVSPPGFERLKAPPKQGPILTI